jgi:hypothetical protein
MKPMKKFLLAFLLCGAVSGLQAQDPPAGNAGADASAAAEAAAAGPGEGAELQDPADREPAEEAVSAAAQDLPEDPGALVEEDPAIAASAEEEFDPDEEISEDYPVPLPSDI